MFDPATITLGQASSTIRDFTVVATLVTVVWKFRGLYEHGVKFFERWNKHMDFVEQGLSTLLTNHLTHIEADLRVLSGRQPNSVDETEK